MGVNPYVGALAGRDAREVLEASQERWCAYVSGVSVAERERAPAPGKWSLREVLCHLADCELAFGFRMRQVYAGAEMIQPFDQDAWAKGYAAYSVELAMETFGALRAWNLAFVEGLTEEDKARTAMHPERGVVTLWEVVKTMAGHEQHHLAALGA